METIISLSTMQTYDIEVKRNSENQMPCPECSQTRRKKNSKCFSYNADKEVGYCVHCNTSFVKHKPFEKKEYVRPEFKFENYTKLSDKAVKWFASRGISQKTLLTMKISEKLEYMPQEEKEVNCIIFPFFQDGQLINLKYRDGKKNFKLSAGAELIWYNYDALLTHDEIIICEGEIDALSFIQAGFDNVISVPNGANTGRMDYFDSSFEILKNKKSFIIATDNDVKGVELKQDLIRRLGIEKCKTVSFKMYKDANEILVKEGVELLQKIINEAKPIPMPDVYCVEDFQNDLDDYFENGIPQAKTIGIPELDKVVRWETGRFATVTGVPGMGKSEFIEFVLCRLNYLYGWGIGFYSPEAMPLKLHFSRLFPKFVGKAYDKKVCSYAEKELGESYLQNNIFWVKSDFDMDINGIISRFEYMVKAKGCKAFMVDPFNRIEYNTKAGLDKMERIRFNLLKLIEFSKRTDSLVILIAHPTKQPKKEGTKVYNMPTAYDVSGSSDFYNMSDYCITVHRAQDDDGKKKPYGIVHVEKTKFTTTMGDTGDFNFYYNINNGRYIHDDLNVPPSQKEWDNSNWLVTEEQQAIFKPLPTATQSEAFGTDNYLDERPF